MRLAAAFLAVAAAGLAQTPDCSLVSGWKKQGPARTYAADNLFEYMDGNAEGYLLYHFVRMNGVNCALGEETLVFDVSEMENAEWAYGMFASNRDSRVPTEKIGVQAQIVPRRGILVKDKYFIEINSPDKEDPDSLRTFLQAMEKRVAGSSDPPEALGWFPAERLVAGSVRMVPESVLGIGALKRGYISDAGAACSGRRFGQLRGEGEQPLRQGEPGREPRRNSEEDAGCSVAVDDGVVAGDDYAQGRLLR